VDALLAPLDVGDGDTALEACVDRATAALNLGRTETDRGNGEAACQALLRSLAQLERVRALRLRPQDAQVESLRTSWARLVERFAPDSPTREDFARRSGALDAPL